MPLLVLAVLGASVNLFRLPLAFESEVVLGPVFALWVAAYRGPLAALFVSVIATIPLAIDWGSLWPVATFGLEALLVGIFYQKFSRNLILTDFAFWLLVGMPVAWVSISQASTIVDSHRVIIMVKQLINGLICAHLAVALGLQGRLRTWVTPTVDPQLGLSLQLKLSRQLASLLAMIAIIFFVFNLQSNLQSFNRELVNRLDSSQAAVIGEMRTQMAKRTIALREAALLFSLLKKQDLDMQVQLDALHQRIPSFDTMLITDKEGRLVNTSPSGAFKKFKEANLKVDDREYFKEALHSNNTFISSGFMGRGFGSRLIVAISQGIPSENKVNDTDSPDKRGANQGALNQGVLNLGVIEGTLVLHQFTDFKDTYNDESKISGILLDQNGKVLFSSQILNIKQLSQPAYTIVSGAVDGHPTLRFDSDESGKLYFFRTDKLPWGWTLISLQDETPLAQKIESGLILLAAALLLLFFVGNISATYISRIWTRSLTVLVGSVNKLSENLQQPLPVETIRELPTELRVLADALETARQQAVQNNYELQLLVNKRTEALQRINTELQKLATEDSLTGLPNRRAFDEKLHNDWKHCRRSNTPLSLIILDIDYFKKVNDSYGHQSGDLILQQIASFMSLIIRRDTDLIARIGGEEFGVILPNSDHDTAIRIAESLRLTLIQNTLKIPDGRDIHVTISGGVATTTDFGEPNSIGKFYTQADKALYRAKSEGRNRVESAQDN